MLGVQSLNVKQVESIVQHLSEKGLVQTAAS